MAPRSLPSRYLRALLRDILVFLLAMLLAVEALYLSDKVITHLLFDVMENRLGLSFLIETIILAVPEILAVGFPLAVLLAVYLALIRRREAGELVILAAAGLAPRALVVVALALALAVAVVWTPFRAFVEPMAAQHLTIRLVEGRIEAISSGSLSPGRFLQHGEVTFFQHPETAGRPGGVFAFVRQISGSEDVLTGGSLILDYKPGATTTDLTLSSAQWLGFALAESGPRRRESHRLDVAHLSIASLALGSADIDAIRREPRTNTLPEVIRRWAAGDGLAGQVALERVLGVALAMLSPLIALLALAWSRGRGTLLALPAALGAVLGAGMALPPLALALLALGMAGALGAALALALVLIAALAWLSARGLPRALLPERPLQ